MHEQEKVILKSQMASCPEEPVIEASNGIIARLRMDKDSLNTQLNMARNEAALEKEKADRLRRERDDLFMKQGAAPPTCDHRHLETQLATAYQTQKNLRDQLAVAEGSLDCLRREKSQGGFSQNASRYGDQQKIAQLESVNALLSVGAFFGTAIILGLLWLITVVG